MSSPDSVQELLSLERKLPNVFVQEFISNWISINIAGVQSPCLVIMVVNSITVRQETSVKI